MEESGVSTRGQADRQMSQDIFNRMEEMFGTLNNNMATMKTELKDNMAVQRTELGTELSNLVSLKLEEYRETCEETSRQLEDRLVGKMEATSILLEQRFETFRLSSVAQAEQISTLKTSLEQHREDTTRQVTALKESVEKHQVKIDLKVGALTTSLVDQREEVTTLKTSLDHRVATAVAELHKNVEEENKKLKQQIDRLIAGGGNEGQPHFNMYNSHFRFDEKVKKFQGKILENPIEHLNYLKGLIGDQYWPEGEKLRVAGVSFAGAALLWWRTTQHAFTDFKEFEAAFRNEYWSVQKQCETRTRLYADKYMSGGYRTLEEHFVFNWERSRNLQPPMEDMEFICMFVSQLPVELQDLLLHSHRGSIQDLREDLRKLDQIEWTRRSNVIPVPKSTKTQEVVRENWREETPSQPVNEQVVTTTTGMGAQSPDSYQPSMKKNKGFKPFYKNQRNSAEQQPSAGSAEEVS